MQTTIQSVSRLRRNEGGVYSHTESAIKYKMYNYMEVTDKLVVDAAL